MNAVKQYRLERDLTIAEMGRIANLAVGTIYRIENGLARPTDRTLYKLRRAFPDFRDRTPEASDYVESVLIPDVTGTG